MVNTKKSQQRLAILIVILALCAAAGAAVYYKHTQDNKKASAGGTGASIQAEKKTTEEFDKNLQKTKNDSKSDAGKTAVDPNLKVANVILVDSSSTQTRGYISNVLEDNGTCAVTLTQGDTKVTETSLGFIDVSKTACAPISYSKLSSGEWTATLSYSSATASGTSEPKRISVP